MATSTLRKQMPVSALLDAKIVWPAIGSAFVKLDPRSLIRHPVMFALEVGTARTTGILIPGPFQHQRTHGRSRFPTCSTREWTGRQAVFFLLIRTPPTSSLFRCCTFFRSRRPPARRSVRPPSSELTENGIRNPGQAYARTRPIGG